MNDCEKIESAPLRIIGIHDPFSAIISEENGADALWLSSYAYCVSQGFPDLGLLPFCSEISTVSRIISATSIPVIVDIDNGFNSKKHALIIAKSLENAGAYALCVEDKIGPKSSSLYETEKSASDLMDIEYFAEIIGHIKSNTSKIKIWARLEGLNYGQSEITLTENVGVCSEAGADCIVLHNTLSDIDKLLSVIRQNAAHRIAIIPTTYMDKISNFSGQKLHAVIFANQILRAQHYHTTRIVKELIATPETVDECVSSIREINQIFNYD